MKKSKYVKVVTHVPVESLQAVQRAVGVAGAGKEGKYSHCSFALKGTGFFTPLEGSKPAIGQVTVAQEVEEYHLEFTCHRDLLESVIKELKKAHPYEEVPVQIYEFLEV